MASATRSPLTVEDVVTLAEARPWAGEPWARELMADLPGRLDAVLAQWDLTVLAVFPDGAGLPVLEVSRHGRPAVLKLSDAGTDVAQQARILDAADGSGCVRLLAHDADQRALLIELLGPSLTDLVADPVAQTDVLLDLLPHIWRLPVSVGLDFTPDRKARDLRALIAGSDLRTSPALQAAHDQATWLTDNPSGERVVVHGDPHASNALRRGEEYVLIDPDGFVCEAEYDVGVTLRDHQRTIDELDRTEGVGAGARWHAGLVAHAAERTGLDAGRIAAWAAVERVTTGIYLGKLGYLAESRAWLSTASRMLGSSPTAQ